MATTLALPNTPDSPADAASPAPSLTRNEAIALVTLALLHFALVHGPIWRHAWTPDASIVWSYVPIPLLVALVLVRRRRLGVASWMLGTLQVATFKFLVSASLLVVLWAVDSPDAVAPSPSIGVSSAPAVGGHVEPGPVEPAIEDKRSIEDRTSSAAPGVQLPPIEVLLGGRKPQTIVLPIGGRLHVRSGDQRMHTLNAPALGLNVPVVPGDGRTLAFRDRATIELGCAVHPDEARVTVVVSEVSP